MVAYSGNNFQFFFRGYIDLFHLGFPKRIALEVQA